jgi:TonB family protein
MNILRMAAIAACLLCAVFAWVQPAWAQTVQRAPEEMSPAWRKDAIRRVMARVGASNGQLQKVQREADLGNVVVAVQVEFKVNGQIASTRIARSSGNPQFDRAVESVVGRAGRLPSFPGRNSKQRVTLVVPLQFAAPPAR